MSSRFFQKQIAAHLTGLVAGCLLGLETNSSAQSNSLTPPVLPSHAELPGRALRATSHSTNRLNRTELEALVKINAEAKRHQAVSPSPRPLPPPNLGKLPTRTQWIAPTNQLDHAALFSQSTALYKQALSDSNLPSNLRKTYEELLRDTQQKDAEFQTNQLLWDNLHKAQESRNSAAIEQAKGELADFLASFSRRAYDKTYPTGTSLEVIIADFKARSATRHSASTNGALKLPP